MCRVSDIVLQGVSTEDADLLDTQAPVDRDVVESTQGQRSRVSNVHLLGDPLNRLHREATRGDTSAASFLRDWNGDEEGIGLPVATSSLEPPAAAADPLLSVAALSACPGDDAPFTEVRNDSDDFVRFATPPTYIDDMLNKLLEQNTDIVQNVEELRQLQEQQQCERRSLLLQNDGAEEMETNVPPQQQPSWVSVGDCDSEQELLVAYGQPLSVEISDIMLPTETQTLFVFAEAYHLLLDAAERLSPPEHFPSLLIVVSCFV